jgi:hypothetical protein
MLKKLFLKVILKIIGSVLCKLAKDMEPMKGSKLYKAADNIFDVVRIYETTR